MGKRMNERRRMREGALCIFYLTHLHWILILLIFRLFL